mmetsp:Transcript_24973/g.37265  ORF Transcript_24973/g.37265 Transcript_24973/m.37265 type:complete len:173 (-) Transcript_24973:451-969(-)
MTTCRKDVITSNTFILVVIVCIASLQINTSVAFTPSSSSSQRRGWYVNQAPNDKRSQHLQMGLYDEPLPPRPPFPSDDNNENEKPSEPPQKVSDTDWDAQLMTLQQITNDKIQTKQNAILTKREMERRQREDAQALFRRGDPNKKEGGEEEEDDWMPNMPKGPVEDEPWFTG